MMPVCAKNKKTTSLFLTGISILLLLSTTGCSSSPNGAMADWWSNQRWAEAQDNSEADMETRFRAAAYAVRRAILAEKALRMASRSL